MPRTFVYAFLTTKLDLESSPSPIPQSHDGIGLKPALVAIVVYVASKQMRRADSLDSSSVMVEMSIRAMRPVPVCFRAEGSGGVADPVSKYCPGAPPLCPPRL